MPAADHEDRALTSIAYVLLVLSTSVVGDGRLLTPERLLAPEPGEQVIAQLQIRQRLIIRVPAISQTTLPVPLPRTPVKWTEKRGPQCVPMNLLAGAAVTQADAIDLYLRGGQRLRARLDDDCPALDYYQGFYVAPAADGQICADRDVIRTRSGGHCAIVKFRTLVPEKVRAQR